jgi:DMSO/TMAO reductase YedYZ heme-binding membrane subunit
MNVSRILMLHCSVLVMLHHFTWLCSLLGTEIWVFFGDPLLFAPSATQVCSNWQRP